jgi:magnesium-transporting ATPase (P-type)
MSEEDRRTIENSYVTMAGSPLRVIAFAYVEMDYQTWENDFLGNGGSADRALDEALSNSDSM